jgi:hypothetical protein
MHWQMKQTHNTKNYAHRIPDAVVETHQESIRVLALPFEHTSIHQYPTKTNTTGRANRILSPNWHLQGGKQCQKISPPLDQAN